MTYGVMWGSKYLSSAGCGCGYDANDIEGTLERGSIAGKGERDTR